MKLAALLLALSPFGLLAAQSPAKPDAAARLTSGNVTVDGTAEVKIFQAVDEAAGYYQQKLEESKAGSVAAIYASFGMTGSAAGSAEDMDKLESGMKAFSERAGTLTKVDPCPGPRLGDTIQRTGYLLLYEHNFAFLDTSLVHTAQGWRLFSLELTCKTDSSETLQRIPGEYYLAGQTSADRSAPPAPVPAEWSAFAIVEPAEAGGCKETIYLVNEHAATATFGEGIAVKSGEAIRFTHHVSASRMGNLTHRFNLGEKEGEDIPVKSVILKGTLPRPDLQ